VLDVGCGTGALLRTLADRLPAGVQLSGVDPASAMLEAGRAALGGHWQVGLAQAVAEWLPFPDASFDLVVSTVSFAHRSDQWSGPWSPPAARLEAGRELVAGRDRRGQLGGRAEGDHQLLVGGQDQGGGVALVGPAVDEQPQLPAAAGAVAAEAAGGEPHPQTAKNCPRV
jgi:SAM-dependent methyltransferase